MMFGALTPIMSILVYGGLAFALVVGAVTAWDSHTDGLIKEGDEQGYRRAQGEFRDAKLKAIKEARAEEHKLTIEANKEADHARKLLDAERTAYADLARASNRLRDQVLAARRTTACGTSTPASAAAGSQAADTAASVLADVQRRLEEAEGATIRFADQSRISGLACERIYETQR